MQPHQYLDPLTHQHQTLLVIKRQHLLMEQADVHDLRDSSTNRENYVRDCRRHGVRANRRSVLITRREVVGISPLDDVLV